MQLVLMNNRIVAHGENFLAMGGVVINTETGAKYDNATVAECDGCPSDLGEVGYEYHAGVFVPCAPYGKATDGEILISCECGTPRRSGVPISGITQIKLLWENAAAETAEFAPQTITLASDDYTFLLIEVGNDEGGSWITRYSTFMSFVPANGGILYGTTTRTYDSYNGGVTYKAERNVYRYVIPNGKSVEFKEGYYTVLNQGAQQLAQSNYMCKPIKIYGVKVCYI